MGVRRVFELAAVLGVVFASHAGVYGMQPEHKLVVDFRVGGEPWRNIDDVVMGGISESRMVIEGGGASFRGMVSLENNGGFASVRSSPGRYDLSGCDGLIVRLRGDGKHYAFRLRTTAAFDGVSYQLKFVAPEGEWQELRLPFDRFEPVFRGRRVPEHPPLDTSAITTMGLIISDGQAGEFNLDIEWIKGIKDRE
jgi:monofunctional biosynthetic peptidoglycan transglycosylase